MLEAGCTHPLPASRQHRFGEIHARHVAARAIGERDRDSCSPGGHVEDRLRPRGCDLRHQLVAPPPVLAEREDLGQQVIPLWQAAEQVGRKRVLGTCSGWAGAQVHPRMRNIFLGGNIRPQRRRTKCIKVGPVLAAPDDLEQFKRKRRGPGRPPKIG